MAGPGPRLCSEREGSVDLGTEVLKEFRQNREAADDDANGDFCIGPEAHYYNIVAEVGRIDQCPRIICPQDRCHASTGHAKGSVALHGSMESMVMKACLPCS